MSTTFHFEKEITISDLLTKTTIKVEKHNNEFWTIDEYNNSLTINLKDITSSNNLELNDILDKKINSLTRHNMNTAYYILKIIVITFQSMYITDDDIDEMFYNDIDSKLTKEDKEKLQEDLWKERTLADFHIDENGIITEKKI
jgi:hypothetical protein